MSIQTGIAPGRFGALDRLCPPIQRRGGGMAGEGGLSLVLHALVLAALLIGVARRHMQDQSAPASVALVFEGGPRAPAPQTQESRRSAPTTAPDVHQTETQPPGAVGAARPTRAQPPPQPAVQPRQAQPEAAAQAAPPAEQAPSAVKLPPPAEQARRAPAPARRAEPAPASPFAALSNPMTLSLAGKPPPVASEGHLQRGINMTLAPTDQNRNVMTRYAEARRKLGEDWWNEFTNFVEAHKYYPLHAAEHGDDGQSVLKLKIARDGTVESVKIELSSGSPELDMAWISVFRGAKVPAFPPGTEENEITFPASMTYILLRE